MQILKNRAFSIIEILIVIVIVVVFVVIAYPQVTNYLTDREVKKEVDSFVEYFEEGLQLFLSIEGDYSISHPATPTFFFVFPIYFL